MNKSQRNYCATHRELLAIVVNAKKFSSYLWGIDFTVRTDHASLKWSMNFRDANGMLVRLISILSEFEITAETIEQGAGNKHTRSGLPTVPYFTVQYRILTPVPSVPYGTENVPFLSNFVI